MNMKKLYSLLLACLLAAGSATAGEGMWLLNKLKQVNEAQMRELGFKLTAEDVYSLNHASMKDAVARLGSGFCSGELVSADGLMLTNHHCGYSAIQSLSTVKDDILTNGFWAMTRDQEKPAGFSVSFLQYITEVTDTVRAALTAEMTEAQRDSVISEIGDRLASQATAGNPHLDANFKSMFEGNEFYLFVYKVYPDVRLVGTPPNAIGKFGGDTDNWQWPRHTGDFSMFRVYAGPDGEPANYSTDNVPLKPKSHFPVSLDGVKKGDFSMIMGFPGSTERFLNSDGVKLALDVEQPSRVKIRGEKLAIMKKHMNADDAVRLKYAAKYAQVANYWKYFIGQQKGLKRQHVFDRKKAQEDDLMAWVNADPARKLKYGGIREDLAKGYAERARYEKASTYMQEAAFGSGVVMAGFRLYGLMMQLEKDPKNEQRITAMADQARGAMRGIWADYDPATDQEVTAAMFKLIAQDVDPAQQPDVVHTVNKKYKGDFSKWAEALFKTSILTDTTRLMAFLAKPQLKVLQKDMGMQAMQSSLGLYRNVLGPAISDAQTEIDKGYRLMEAAMMEKDPQKMWYPDANSTERLTYGIVNDYKPADAVHYDYFTTELGILQKEDPSNDEFIVPARQKELLLAKDFGRYADEDGSLHINFISENDITGGNSGSPVINGNGELIGIAFDGNWEAMSGDISYEPELQRTISVDIRYVLWVIDKFAGAKHLVDEMTLVKTPKAAPAPVEAVPATPAPAVKKPVRKG
ncbi:MAG TPA: S46 family peptidase [Flavobacteriales bacterium]|nr:S46 family peptidase [Flavobacteriales bacterium]HRP81290.1 S46 family peptidase [Flavobacteriales bacterium]HRQ84701.1 S46 family peptidase [Flavobacteriales bacterium]